MCLLNLICFFHLGREKIIFLILFITDIPAISEKRTQAFVSVSVGVIFICIGLPLWWNTTKVYRAALPYDEIEQLNQIKVSCINRKSSNA